MTWPYHSRWIWIISSVLTTTHRIVKNISHHPTNQIHLAHNPDHMTDHNSDPPHTTLPHQEGKLVKHDTDKFSPIASKIKPCLPVNTLLNSLNLFFTLPILAYIASDAPSSLRINHITQITNFSTSSKTSSPLLNSNFCSTEQLWPRHVMQTSQHDCEITCQDVSEQWWLAHLISTFCILNRITTNMLTTDSRGIYFWKNTFFSQIVTA